ncbi:MAG TPA: hypothetical protein VH814_09480 [Steroidobacteraceae bacterium]|jgi:hypothetical protein
MERLLLLALLITSAASAADSPAVDSRLAIIVEGAVRATGLSINISQATLYSVNINKINGRSVCDPAAASEVKQLQDALNDQAGIKENYGPAYYSLTSPDGTRKVVSALNSSGRKGS